MSPLHIPRARLRATPRWLHRLALGLRRLAVGLQIDQVRCALADELAHDRDAVTCAVLEARLVELRCELHALEMQQ